jgi:hypothetical protein
MAVGRGVGVTMSVVLMDARTDTNPTYRGNTRVGSSALLALLAPHHSPPYVSLWDKNRIFSTTSYPDQIHQVYIGTQPLLCYLRLTEKERNKKVGALVAEIAQCRVCRDGSTRLGRVGGMCDVGGSV